MRRITTVIFMLACMTAVHAQDAVFRIGVKGAYNSTWLFNKNVSDKNASLDYASSYGSTFGIQGIYMLGETYGIDVELNYASHNQKYDGDIGGGASYESKINLSYLDIPLLFRVSSEKGPYFEIGPQLSFLMGAKEDFSTTPSTPADYSDRDFKDDFNGFGAAGILGFGIDIKASENVYITAGLRFGYAFTDATKEYTEAEADALQFSEKQSLTSQFAHTKGSADIFGNNATFGYAKTNRAFGGLNIGVQFAF